MDLPIPATVYGLKSTRDNRLRYIGQTQNDPISRYYKHMASAKKGEGGKVGAWIRGEMADGFKIRQTIIVEHGVLDETEIEVIRRARASGYDLLNYHKGGGWNYPEIKTTPMSAATRAKISAAQKGKKASEETRAKLRAASPYSDDPFIIHETMNGELAYYLDSRHRLGAR